MCLLPAPLYIILLFSSLSVLTWLTILISCCRDLSGRSLQTGPGTVFFSFQFYRYPQVTTERSVNHIFLFSVVGFSDTLIFQSTLLFFYLYLLFSVCERIDAFNVIEFIITTLRRFKHSINKLKQHIKKLTYKKKHFIIF